jgi:hypothetical protein
MILVGVGLLLTRDAGSFTRLSLLTSNIRRRGVNPENQPAILQVTVPSAFLPDLFTPIATWTAQVALGTSLATLHHILTRCRSLREHTLTRRRRQV